jgi:hypothetical protein
MSNIYHIVDFIPGFEPEEMLVGHEELAQNVVKSGRLRIDAGDTINFARLYIPNLDISMMFSYREVYDASLIPRTRKIIASQVSRNYSGRPLELKIDEFMDILKAELRKYSQPTEEEEMKLARLLVQAAHPVVTMLVLLDNAEIFLSHSYNIGDMLDVVNWHTSGKNSGMQSTDGRDVAVFVSCGGDPLKENEDKNSIYGDGWPAVARLFIIAGQELGHYSDIMRDENGKQISRYSANFSGTKAKEVARIGRLNDIKYSNQVLKILNDSGLEKLANIEKNFKFYQDNKVYGFVFLKEWIKLIINKFLFVHKLKKQGLDFIDKSKYEKRPATIIRAMVADMLFNLAPQADVYKSEDSDEEDAIACIEALARVPQQVNKWGRIPTKVFMRDLYRLYYGTVIPGCIKTYENVAKKPYFFDMNKVKPSLMYIIKKLFKKTSVPMREV